MVLCNWFVKKRTN